MLAALGGLAAWYAQRQHVTASEVIAEEVHSLVAIHNLYIAIREVRYQLNQYLRLGSERHLEEIEALDQQANRLLREAIQLANSDRERQQLNKVEEGYRLFFSELHRSRSLPTAERQQLLEQWANSKINELILEPAQECVTLNEQVVSHTNEANRQIARNLTVGFLILGVTGSAAGLLVGLIIARSLRRSLWELHASVAGAAGTLERLDGPFPAPPTGGLIELRMGAKFLERRATQVVEQLQKREHEVLRNEQLAAVGQLAAGVAHELRNPLMPMKMLVQSALSKPNEGGLQGRQLLILDEEISRMETSIKAFLDFARPPEVEKRNCDLREIIEGAVSLVEGRACTLDVTIIQKLPDHPCNKEVDPIQIKQVVLNLLLNAMDELKPEGVIQIELSAERLSDGGAELNANQDGPLGTCLIIRDNGMGIPPELLPRIFEPFISDKELGTGLGLTICKRIIEAHGGKLTARNQPGGGAEFMVWLPD